MQWDFNLYSVINIALCFYLQISSSTQDTLKAVQVIFRHGDRNPLHSYPNDPFKNISFWPEGWGSLTYNGKVKLFNLGRYMKERYPDIPRKNVYAYSSEKNRTILSGMANLAGFYMQDQSILKHIEKMNHTIFRLRIIPLKKDNMIIIGQPCEKWVQLFNDFFQRSEYMRRYVEQYKHVFNAINENSGENFTYLSHEMIFLMDTLLIEKSREFTTPAYPAYPQWVLDLYKTGDLEKIRGDYVSLYLHTFDLKRLHVGSMVQKFFERMDTVINELERFGSDRNLEIQRPQMTIISGHDISISNWLVILGIYDGKLPTYGAALFIELHETDRSDEDEYYIKLYYKKQPDSEPELMNIPECPNPCRYEKLRVFLEPLMLKDRAKACKVDDGGGFGNKNSNPIVSDGTKVNVGTISNFNNEGKKEKQESSSANRVYGESFIGVVTLSVMVLNKILK